MYFYVFVVFYTQLLVLMLQYHISTTKHSTVPLFKLYVLLCVCCIFHTITSTNVTISYINNQTFYRSLVYTVCSFMCSLYFTHNQWYYCYNITYQQPNILPFPCLYGTLFCVRCIVHTITCTNVTISHINN